MDPLVQTTDKGKVETVDFSRRTCSEEGDDRPIGHKCDGRRFLEFKRCGLHRPLGTESRSTVKGLYYAELMCGFEAKL